MNVVHRCGNVQRCDDVSVPTVCSPVLVHEEIHQISDPRHPVHYKAAEYSVLKQQLLRPCAFGQRIRRDTDHCAELFIPFLTALVLVIYLCDQPGAADDLVYCAFAAR